MRPRFFLSIVLAAVSLSLAPAPPVRTWTELGPRSSGRVSTIAATDVQHIWAASPGGGVWKSVDGGSHWNWAGNYGLGDFTALDLEFDRNDANRLYLRTWNGFLVSTDGAAHWKQTLYAQGGDTSNFQPSFACGVFPACPPYASVTEFEPRPFTQMVLSARQSILLTALPCGGLQYSIDSGNSFKQLWPFPGAHPETNADNCIISIAGDEATGKVYFASMGSGDSVHIFGSSAPWTATGPSSALRWELVNRGMTGHEPAASLAWGGSANRLMAVVTDWSVQPSHATAYLFNGTSWTPKPFNNPRCIMSDARALVWGGGNDFFAGGVTFGYTANAGDSWVCPDLNQQYVDIRAIHADRKLRQVWIGGDQSALESHFVISRYPWMPGASIAPATGSNGLGISSWQAYSVAAPPALPNTAHHGRVLVGAQDVAAACTDDGAHWRLLPTDESQSMIWRRNGSGDVVYSYSTLGTLQRSTNAGSAAACANIVFSSASPPDSLRESKAFVGPHTMAVHPTDTNRIYLATARSIIHSRDGGAHWAKAPFTIPGRTKAPSPTALFVDETGSIYTGTLDGGAFLCSDAAHLCDGSPGSGKWVPWGLNSGSPRVITAITESNGPPAPRTFWMATSQGVYRRLSSASAWTLASQAPGYAYSDVAVDPSCHSRIYAAVGYLEPISRSRGGIDFSSDNGATWTSLTAGAPLHNVPITQVILAPGAPGRVLASTYGRGAWEYDWGETEACK